jgi:integrase
MRTSEARWIEARSRWQINVQQDGERKTFTSTIEGKKGKIEAEKKADRWLASRAAADKLRFEQLWKDFLQEKKDTTGAANYTKLEQIGRLWLLPDLKHKRAAAITGQEWQDCINAAFKKGLSKRTCESVRGAITSCCKYARKRKLPVDLPEDLTIPRNAPVGERSILKPDDLKTLFKVDSITHYNKPVLCFFIPAWRFLVLTGLRRGELCGLRQEDLKGGIVHLKRSVNSEGEETRGKNENARRYFALSKHAQAVLDAQAQLLKKRRIISPWMFPDEEGQRLDPNHLYKKWLTYRTQHGIKCSLHEMRHTLISVAKADVPEQLLKRVVGHSKSMDTFGVYGHDVDGEIQRVASLLDDTFDRLLS